MSKILILLVGLAMTWGLVATFGIMSIAVCFALALGTLLFSTEPGDGEVVGVNYSSRENLFGSPSTFMGGL